MLSLLASRLPSAALFLLIFTVSSTACLRGQTFDATVALTTFDSVVTAALTIDNTVSFESQVTIMEEALSMDVKKAWEKYDSITTQGRVGWGPFSAGLDFARFSNEYSQLQEARKSSISAEDFRKSYVEFRRKSLSENGKLVCLQYLKTVEEIEKAQRDGRATSFFKLSEVSNLDTVALSLSWEQSSFVKTIPCVKLVKLTVNATNLDVDKAFGGLPKTLANNYNFQIKRPDPGPIAITVELTADGCGDGIFTTPTLVLPAFPDSVNSLKAQVGELRARLARLEAPVYPVSIHCSNTNSMAFSLHLKNGAKFVNKTDTSIFAPRNDGLQGMARSFKLSEDGTKLEVSYAHGTSTLPAQIYLSVQTSGGLIEGDIRLVERGADGQLVASWGINSSATYSAPQSSFEWRVRQ